MTTKISLALAAATLAASIGFASAQTALDHAAHHPGAQGMGQSQAQPAQMHSARMAGGMPMGMTMTCAGPTGHVEGRIAFFKAELRITDAQLPQWNAFADTLRNHAARLRQLMQQTNPATVPPPAPAQMERDITVLSTRLDTMRATLAAARPLYAVLTDEQKKIADELLAEHMVAMHGAGL